MITKTYSGDRWSCRLVIRRNCSLTWGQTKLALVVISIPPLVIALACALAGLWPVVPYTGLELLVVGACFYRCARNAQEREVVTISGDEIVVQKGRKRVERNWSLSRHWAAIVLDRSAKTWHPSRLFIRAHAQVVELGRFLVEQERIALAGDLRKLVGHGWAGSARPATY